MRRKEGNKEQDILKAAIEVFASEGYYPAKISKIAEKANIATGSVYLYFKNKDQILIKIFEELWKKIFEQVKILSLRNDLNPVEKLDAYIDVVFDLFTASPSLALVFVREQPLLLNTKGLKLVQYYDDFLKLGEALIQSGIDSGDFNKNLNVNIIKNFTFGGVRHLLHQWALKPNDFPLNKVRQDVKFIIKKGLLV